jgi:hypothetical protein
MRPIIYNGILIRVSCFTSYLTHNNMIICAPESTIEYYLLLLSINKFYYKIITFFDYCLYLYLPWYYYTVGISIEIIYRGNMYTVQFRNLNKSNFVRQLIPTSISMHWYYSCMFMIFLTLSLSFFENGLCVCDCMSKIINQAIKNEQWSNTSVHALLSLSAFYNKLEKKKRLLYNCGKILKYILTDWADFYNKYAPRNEYQNIITFL